MKSMPDACDETGCQLVEYSPFGDSCQLETFFFAYFFFEKSKCGLGQRPSKFFFDCIPNLQYNKNKPQTGLVECFFLSRLGIILFYFSFKPCFDVRWNCIKVYFWFFFLCLSCYFKIFYKFS